MTDDAPIRQADPSRDDAPTWLRILQAAVIGVIAGLALNAILSMIVLQGAVLAPERKGPAECRKSAPAHDAVAPSPSNAPSIGSIRWKMEGIQARR